MILPVTASSGRPGSFQDADLAERLVLDLGGLSAVQGQLVDKTEQTLVDIVDVGLGDLLEVHCFFTFPVLGGAMDRLLSVRTCGSHRLLCRTASFSRRQCAAYAAWARPSALVARLMSIALSTVSHSIRPTGMKRSCQNTWPSE